MLFLVDFYLVSWICVIDNSHLCVLISLIINKSETVQIPGVFFFYMCACVSFKPVSHFIFAVNIALLSVSTRD